MEVYVPVRMWANTSLILPLLLELSHSSEMYVWERFHVIPKEKIQNKNFIPHFTLSKTSTFTF